MMTFTEKFYDALELAARAHRNQLRKGTDIPYFTHPAAVAMLLLRHGFGEGMAIAALLHDTVEDTDVTLEEIRLHFGDRVAELVKGASEEDRSASWEERKYATLVYLKTAPPDVAALSCADKLHNAISIARDRERHGEAVWERFHRGREKMAWYYRGLVYSLGRSMGKNAALYRELRDIVEGLFGLGERGEQG